MDSIPSSLKRLQLRPSKGLGQNFLVQKGMVKKIVRTADIHSTDLILEIGPGTGIMTEELAREVQKVIAIEKDKNMKEFLDPLVQKHPNIDLLWGDALALLPKISSPYNKVVANIPYYITSRLLRIILELEQKSLDAIVLLVQKEVATRICAKPPRMNLLAVSVQYYGSPTIKSSVSRGNFYPVPNVDSAILQILPHHRSLQNHHAFFTIVKAGFSQPRKQLMGNLQKKLRVEKQVLEHIFEQLDMKPTVRSQELSLAQWKSLVSLLSPHLS